MVAAKSRAVSDHHVRTGIPELLAEARARGIGLGIVSNAHAGGAHRRILEELGLDDDAAREWAGMFAQAILSVLQGWVVQSCLLPGFDHGAYLDYARTLAAQ